MSPIVSAACLIPVVLHKIMENKKLQETRGFLVQKRYFRVP